MPSSISHHFAHVNGVRLHHADAGSGTLMLFLHGFPEFWYAWRAQLHEFGTDHHAVAPDLRGYNLSDKPEGAAAYGVKLLIEDVRQLALSLTAEKFILAGHDWGGAIAWAFAVAFPEMLERLVIVNAPHPVPFARELAANPAQQAASAYMNFFREMKAERVLSDNGFERLARMTLDGWGGGGADAATRAAYLEAWSREGALTAMLNYYRASPLHPPAAGDPGASKLKFESKDFMVRVPTLVIWGEQDSALLPGNLDGLDQCVPDLAIRRIPEATHWVIHERPGLVNALIREFVSR